MKKLIFIIPILLLCSGCLMYNSWIIKGNGKNLKGTYQVAGGQAENMDVVFTRTLLLTTQKVDKEFLNNLPKIKITVNNGTKSVEIGAKK